MVLHRKDNLRKVDQEILYTNRGLTSDKAFKDAIDESILIGKTYKEFYSKDIINPTRTSYILGFRSRDEA